MAACEMLTLAMPWLAALSGPPILGIPSVLTTEPLFVIVIALELCVTVIPVSYTHLTLPTIRSV